MQRAARLFIIVFFLFILVLFFISYSQKQDQAKLHPVEEISLSTCEAQDFAPGQLRAHFLKHGYQFGPIAESDYLHAAREILNAKPSKDLWQKRQTDGDIAHYKPSTREFAVMTPSCRIRTYFKASDSYWAKQ